jgi:hypothetical protein
MLKMLVLCLFSISLVIKTVSPQTVIISFGFFHKSNSYFKALISLSSFTNLTYKEKDGLVKIKSYNLLQMKHLTSN